MKLHTKTKNTSYINVLIEDESGLDTIKVRKELFMASFAAKLRQIASGREQVKA